VEHLSDAANAIGIPAFGTFFAAKKKNGLFLSL